MTSPLGIAGYSRVQDRILNYLIGGRLHPAIILAGEDKNAKWALAKNVAKYFLCNQKKGKAPFCNDCNHCRRIEKEIHPDTLLHRSTEEDHIKIDTVRDFCHQMEVGPIEQRFKICIIDEAHRMNPAAANALLKTLEEPGEGRFFWLLTSQPGALLPTILSRCLKFHMPPEALAPIDESNWETLFEDFQKHKEPHKLSSKIDSKEKAIDFLRFLQRRLHDQALPEAVGASQNAAPLIEVYEESIELEARLRSNANYGLMLENFLARNY